MERFSKYMEIKGLNDNQVTIDCGLSVGLLGQARKGKSDLGAKAIDKILITYQDLNRVWLLTGDGEMINEIEVTRMDHPKSSEKLEDADVPLYDIDAAANLRTLMGDKTANILGRISIPNIPSCDGAVYVRGDSMYPLLKTGDISAYWARHTFATLLAELDTPIDTISLALGHSYGSRITQVYINPDLRKADEAVRRLINYVYRK